VRILTGTIRIVLGTIICARQRRSFRVVAAPASVVCVLSFLPTLGVATHFVVEPMFQFASHLASGGLSDLIVPLLHQRAVRYFHVVNSLKIFSQRHQHLNVEFHAASNEFGAVAFVVAHVEPFHLQRDIRIRQVAGRKLSGDAQHLLESMEMIHRRHHEFLVEHMISAGHQVDVLAILGRALVERFDHE
jgi:hypothetical protein